MSSVDPSHPHPRAPPSGSLSSLRSKTYLETAIRWAPIVKKYRSLKEAPKVVVEPEA